MARTLRSVRIDPSNGLSPDEAALIAVAVNPQLQAIRDNRGIARSVVVAAGILPNPQLATSVQVPTHPATTHTVSGYGVGLSWNLTPLLSVGKAVEAAELKLESVALDVAWQEWQVAQAARLNAGRLVFLRRRVELAERSVAAFQTQVSTLETALAQGNTTILTLAAAQSAMQRASVTHFQVLQQERIAKLDLLAALGVAPTAQLDIDPNAALPTWNHLPELQDLLEALPKQRLDLRALRRGYKSQSVQIRTQVLRQFPPLIVNVGRASDTSDVGTVGFSVTLGLPFFNRNQGQVALAVATESRLYDQYIARVQSARYEIARALANLTWVRKQIAVLQDAVPTLKHLVALAAQQTGQGNVSLIDLYDLRVRLFTTQLSLQALLQSELELGVALDIAAGTIVADPPVEGT